MDLQIDGQHFVVCGASSGFGNAVAKRILEEGATVCGIARRKEELEQLKSIAPSSCDYINGDLTSSNIHDKITEWISGHNAEGIVINSGGPPPGGALDFEIEDWDQAYESVLRWKISLIQKLLPKLRANQYGRIVIIESQSIKQPIPDLALSNTFRAGMAGFAKTLSREVARDGITVNILAPGAHTTPAIERVVEQKARNEEITKEEARNSVIENIPVGRMGKPEEFSSLAAWLLSPLSSYVTGQILSHEGGNISGLFG